jgi:hypothetical protein
MKEEPHNAHDQWIRWRLIATTCEACCFAKLSAKNLLARPTCRDYGHRDLAQFGVFLRVDRDLSLRVMARELACATTPRVVFDGNIVV